MLVGIDIGTQSLKAVVAGDDLAVLGRGAVPYGVDHPRPGWAQQDPRLWERALPRAVHEALADAGRPGGEVRALGLAGQLDGCVAVDAAGEPLGDCLIWMDRRAIGELDDILPELVRRRCGIVADAGHMAAKIRWLKRHGEKGRGAARYHQPVSYMVERLTGAAVLDPAVASTCMLFDLERGRWDIDLMRRFGIAPNELPVVRPATAVAGPLRPQGAEALGLPAGIPVAIGTGDDFSTPLGAGVAAPGILACVLGTAEVTGAVSRAAVFDGQGLLETHCYPAGGYFIENPGWLSGGAVAWLSQLCHLAGPAELDRLAAAVPAGADGLLFLPALTGAMAPEWVAGARGCFYGLTQAHGPGHLARAVLEGCTNAMVDVVERLRGLGLDVGRIRLLGGGARSALWAQIRADASGLPVEVPEEVDTSPVGAAMLAAVAGGLASDLAACATAVGRVYAMVEPKPALTPRYQESHAAYRRLFASLRPLYASPDGDP
jgi:xylulokinase